MQALASPLTHAEQDNRTPMSVAELLKPPRPLNLRKRFALTSLVVITAIALVLGWVLSNVLTERMLQREGEVNMDFIRNLLTTDDSARYFVSPDDPALRERFLRSTRHITSMEEPVRANAYSRDGQVLWSTSARLIGQRFTFNPELDEALRGHLVVHGDYADGSDEHKPEHMDMEVLNTFFVESYIPILDPESKAVLGVMELYKVPTRLNADIAQGLRQLWLACLLCAIGLFVTLYWIVARADRTLREQQLRLAEAQSLASAVELAGAVAHNLRNPLAAIRSSAERMEETAASPDEVQDMQGDIIEAVDRADRWITELLHVAQTPQIQPDTVDLRPLVKACLEEMSPEMTRHHIIWRMDDAPPIVVKAHQATLRQILLSILANAVDAMPGGGHLRVDWIVTPDLAGLRLSDSGVGLSTETQQRLFRPFFSTESGGLGIGLALVRRLIEQWQGQVRLGTAEPRGNTIEVVLPRVKGVPLTTPEQPEFKDFQG